MTRAAPLDLTRTERQLNECARSQGIDLDSLCERAGRHFQDDVFRPRPELLTDSCIELLVEDEMAQEY